MMSNLEASYKVNGVELATLLFYEVKGNAGSRAILGQMNDLPCQHYSQVSVLGEEDLRPDARTICSLHVLNFLLLIHEFSVCVFSAAQVTSIFLPENRNSRQKNSSFKMKGKKRYSDHISLLYENKILKLAKAYMFCSS